MRILVVNTLFPPDIKGGAEISLSTACKGLVGRGHSVDVLCTGDIGCSYNYEGISVTTLPVRNIYRANGSERPRVGSVNKAIWHGIDTFNFWAFFDVCKQIRVTRPDVILTNNVCEISVSAWAAAKACGVPVVHVIRDYYLLCVKASMRRNGINCRSVCLQCRPPMFFKREASRWVDAVVGISDHVLDVHVASGFFKNAQTMKVIPNPVTFRSMSPRSIGAGRALTFGYIGRISPEKGLDVALESFSKLEGRGLRFLVAGRSSDGYASSLEESTRDERVQFLGFRETTEFFDLIDWAVVPSLWEEPFGRVVIEALAHGVPVIAHDVGGIAGIIRGTGMTSFMYGAALGTDLMTQYKRAVNLDADQYAELSFEALRIARQFTVDAVCDEYEAVLSRF